VKKRLPSEKKKEMSIRNHRSDRWTAEGMEKQKSDRIKQKTICNSIQAHSLGMRGT
jgi:hypothetical protein